MEAPPEEAGVPKSPQVSQGDPTRGRARHDDAMEDAPECRRPLQRTDAVALIGLLAILEGEIWGHGLDEHLIDRLRRRFFSDGLVADAAGGYELRQVINDLNHRIRYAIGEYEDPPTSIPPPP